MLVLRTDSRTDRRERERERFFVIDHSAAAAIQVAVNSGK